MRKIVSAYVGICVCLIPYHAKTAKGIWLIYVSG